MVACESLCIPFDENIMAEVEEPFGGGERLLLLIPLEQWSVDKQDIAKVTFRLPEYHLPIFNQIL